MTRHNYRHRETGIETVLNDSFAAVFGDLFERVDAPEQNADDTDSAANPDNLNASKEEK